MESLSTQTADIEVIVKNLRPSKHKIASGYRPAFLIKQNYLTSGEIRFKDASELEFGEESFAEIRFICPEEYPHCLCIGQTIRFQEGSKVCGHATITKIYNKILEK